MGNSLKSLRLAKGWTHDEAAEAMGISRGQFIKLERGERGLTEARLQKASRIFGVSVDAVLGSDTAPNRRDKPPGGAFEAEIEVFASAEGGPGVMVVSADPIETVPRPWYLGNIKEGFAVLIAGESMEPAYEAGDLAIVNPKLPFVRGADFIFTTGDREDADWRGTIKRLRGWTDKEWRVEQFNPRREFSLSRKEWPEALRVVGRHSRR
jgi:phage repressor protein C with HTH and peptisase S24 domain